MITYNIQASVEIFHLLFLSLLGRKLDKKLYSLKGGCNMRFYFGSIRYSEDMDLDVQIIAKDTLRKNINQILNSSALETLLGVKGIEIDSFSEPKQTDTTQRWKVSLNTKNTSLKLPTKIEFSRRLIEHEIKFEPIDTVLIQQYSLMPVLANHYSIAAMYNQKIAALAHRSQTQARDIFDLYWLILTRKNELKNSESNNTIITAQENALSVSFDDFKGQVLSYLEYDHKKQYDNKTLWENIVTTVVDSLIG
ncbi:MAG: nucleotidyl transferase AbiEii/AbiGii toxin family protein [Gammaproteobacteria bacterium]